MKRRTIDSPAGRLMLQARDGILCRIEFAAGDERADDDDQVLDEAQRQLAQYFAGERKAFDLPLEQNGTAFERAVWARLNEIPFGETQTYGQIAAALGKPKASRAVGGACSRNPVLLAVPCHRVLAASGALTGFAAGMPAKRTLLALEGHEIRQNRIRL